MLNFKLNLNWKLCLIYLVSMNFGAIMNSLCFVSGLFFILCLEKFMLNFKLNWNPCLFHLVSMSFGVLMNSLCIVFDQFLSQDCILWYCSCLEFFVWRI